MSVFGLQNLCAAWQHYVADGVVVLALLIFGIIAAKKGFVRCFFSFIATIAALVVAFVFMNKLIEWTDGLFGLQAWLNETLVNALSAIAGFDIDISAVGITTALEGKLPSFLVSLIAESVGDSSLPVGTTAAMVAGEALGGVATGFVAWLALFLVTKLVCKLLEKILGSLAEKLPIVGAVNTLLGLVVGLLQGLIVVSAVVAVLSFIPVDGMTAFFNECTLVSWLYNNNPITYLLSLIIKW